MTSKIDPEGLPISSSKPEPGVSAAEGMSPGRGATNSLN